METAVKLHIYFDGELTEDEVYEKLNKMLGNSSFQIYETEKREI